MSAVFLRLNWLTGVKIAISGALIFWSNITLAQVTPDTSLGSESSVVIPNLTIENLPSDLIDRGAIRGINLFHSFQEFNVEAGRGVYFTNPQGIENILSRVTGTNPSNILGTLGVLGNANLYLMNPNGIVFSENASLDVQGSFVATTANAIRLGNTGLFSASEPASSDLLSIHPTALFYNVLAKEAAIVNRSQEGINVPNGQSLFLIGGNVKLEGGVINAPGGRVELGGLTAPGIIEMKIDSLGKLENVSFPMEVQRADVELSNQAKVLVTAAGGGSISVNTQNLNILGRSSLNAGIANNAGTVDTVAGDINVDATGVITLKESSVIQNIVNEGATGNAGKINLVGDSLNLLTGSQLFSSSLAKGNGGDVNVRVGNTVTFDSAGNNTSTSGIISSIGEKGEGNAGNINISTGSFVVSNGAQLNTITFAKGNAGTVNINATGKVSFDGANVGASGIISAVGITGNGKGGDINITAGSLAVTNGAQLNALTRNEGNAGNVNIIAQDTVLIDGENANSVNDPYAGVSSIFTSVGIDDAGKQARGNGGNINITTGSLLMTNGGQLNAITKGIGNAGNVNINARDTITLDGERRLSSTKAASSIFTSVDGNEYSGYSNLGTAIGNGGDITITTGTLSITRGAALSALTKGQGNAGNVTVTADNKITLDGENSNKGASGIFSSVDANLYTDQPRAVGDGGDVKITTGSLAIARGAGVFAVTTAQGNAGNVTINAKDTIAIDGENSNQGSSGIFSSVDANLYTKKPPALGNGGKIKIDAGKLSLTNGGGVFAATAGQGDAGDVTINARNTVTIDGENSKKSGSGVYSSVDANLYSDRQAAIGNGGNISITTDSLSVTNGGGLFAATAGQGDAGNVNVNARQVLFDGLSTNGGSSGIFSDVKPNAVGNGKNINVSARELTVRNGARLSASTEGNGAAGNIEIDAQIVDISSSVPTSGLFVSTVGQGKGGDLAINSNLLTLTNSEVSARSQSTENAGQINIKVADLISMIGSNITTAADRSAGGAITITAGDMRLFGDSDITTNVFSGASGGGNITLNANSIVALSDSDILAFAQDGKGGDITLNTPAFFGQNYQPTPTGTNPLTLDGNNRVDINASGSIPGVITLPDTSFIQNSLSELPEGLIDTSSLIANSCIARSSRQQEGTFIITGSGGLPSRPGEALISQYTFGTVRNVSSSAKSPRRPWQKGDPIVEPQGVYRLPSAQLVLSRECS
ncbi:two-partner secretion domain-containing protein [Calothrix sp. NIES-2098]|uniref:two-partner secretion domain-containing protein n=1 Tax=Calothrix sp. NIES-2098 TaxID=1954171 RepID=UPI000B620E5C|nr:filamentous hemagglutinin outer membrane protein [Calothrix sp. NIES-2098]